MSCCRKRERSGRWRQSADPRRSAGDVPSNARAHWMLLDVRSTTPIERHYACLLDHLVRQYEEVRREGQAKCPSRLEVEDQLVLRRLLHWEVGGLRAL